MQKTQQGRGVQDRETAQVVRRHSGSSITVRQGDLDKIRATHIETHPKPTRSCEDFHAIDTNPTTVKFGIASSLSGRVQPVLSTGTQDEEGKAHGVGVPHSLVGRPSTSGESRSPQKMSDHRSTTALSTTCKAHISLLTETIGDRLLCTLYNL